MIFLSFSLFYFVLIQLHFQEVTCGGTSTFYYTIKSNDFNTAQDIQFGNSSNPNRRRANYSVAHSVAGPVCSFVTGISLFEMSSSGFLDFTIYKISSTNCTGSTSYSIELAPFVGITSMTYTLFMINSGNVSVSLSFNRINASFPDTFILRSKIHSVTTKQLIFSLQTDTTNKFYDLCGTILIFGLDLDKQMGFQLSKVNLDSPLTMKMNIGKNTSATILKYYLKNLNYLKEPTYFGLLNSWNMSKSVSITLRRTFTYEPGNTPILWSYLRTDNGPLDFLEFDLFILCNTDNTCLLPFDYSTKCQASQSWTSEYLGTDIAINGTTNRTIPLNYPFEVYFDRVPKYAAVGFYKLSMPNNFNSLKLKIESVQAQSIAMTVTVGPNAYAEYVGIVLFASDWDGVQYYFYDFSNHPQFISVFQQGNGSRSLTYAVLFAQSVDMAARKNATIFFTEMTYKDCKGNITLKQSYSGSNSTHVFVTVYTEDTISWMELRGYVAIYSLGGSDSNFELNHALISYDPILITKPSSVRTFYRNATFSHLYAVQLSTQAFITQFKLTNIDKKIIISATNSDIYTPKAYAFISTITFKQDSGRAYELGMGVVAFYKNPQNSAWILDQRVSANQSIPQTVRFMISNFSVPAYALLIADRPTFTTNFGFRFQRTEDSAPRIFRVYKFDMNDDTYINTTMLPFDVPLSYKLTLDTIPLYPAGDTLWTISIFQANIFYYPESQAFKEWIGQLDYNSFSADQRNHLSIEATRYLELNNSVQVRCQVDVTFSGMIHILFIDSDLLLSDSSFNISWVKRVQSFRRALIEPNGFVTLTITGRNLSVYNFSFTNCTDIQSNPVQVGVKNAYYSMGTNFTDAYIQYTNNTVCGDNCIACKNLSYCYKCEYYTFLYEGICYSRCPNNLAVSLGRFCDITYRFQSFILEPLIYNTETSILTFTYVIDHKFGEQYLLTVLFPTRIDLKKLPLLQGIDKNFSLAQTSQLITPIKATPYPLVGNIKPLVTVNQNKNANLYVFSTKTAFLIITYDSPNFTGNFNYTYLENITNLELSPDKATTIQFFINCSQSCQLVLSFNGTIQININYRTTVLSLTYSTFDTYILNRKFSNLEFIQIDVINSSMFNLSVSAQSYEVFSQFFYLMEDSIEFPVINNCSISGCQNCVTNTYCLSCEEGRYLNMAARSCTSSCITNNPSNMVERRCFCSDNTECMMPQASKCDLLAGSCIPCSTDSDCFHLSKSNTGIICHDESCIECPENCLMCNFTQCLTCNQGFVLTDGLCNCEPGMKLLNSICMDICGDGIKPFSAAKDVCDDNNTISSDGCSNDCKIEEGHICLYGSPISVDVCMLKTIMSLSQHSTTIFNLEFTQGVFFFSNISNIVDVTILNTNKEDYNYNILITSNNSLSIEIIALRFIPKSKLIVSIKDMRLLKDINYNEIANAISEIEMKTNISPLNQKVQEIASALTEVTTALSSATSATSGAIFLTSLSPTIIWGILNLFQLFYCLQLINVDYPENVQHFFDIFKIGRLNMIPNPFEALTEIFHNEKLPVPKRFADQNMNGIFLANSGSMLSIWILSFSLYLASLIIGKYLVKVNPLIKALAIKFKNSFDNGGMIQLWIGSYFDISLSIFLQFRAVNSGSFFIVFSMLIAIGFLSLNIFIPLNEYLHPTSNDKKSKHPLYKDFLEDPWFKKYYIFLWLGRRMGIAGSLVIFHDFPLVQITSLILISIIPMLITIFATPYKKIEEKIVRAIDDAVYFMINLLIFFIIYDNMAGVLSYNSQINLGWVMIALCIISVVTNLVMMLFSQLKEIVRMAKILKNRVVIKKIRTKRIIKRKQNLVKAKVNKLRY